MIVGGACIELGGSVRRCPTQGHVAPILGQKDRVPCVTPEVSGPIELPDCKVRVTVEAKQHPRGIRRITNEEARQSLTVERIVADPTAFNAGLIERRRLKKDTLLPPPDERQQTQNDNDKAERYDHASRARGFQWLCMAGNLRQCEFRLNPFIWTTDCW